MLHCIIIWFIALEYSILYVAYYIFCYNVLYLLCDVMLNYVLSHGNISYYINCMKLHDGDRTILYVIYAAYILHDLYAICNVCCSISKTK